MLVGQHKGGCSCGRGFNRGPGRSGALARGRESFANGMAAGCATPPRGRAVEVIVTLRSSLDKAALCASATPLSRALATSIRLGAPRAIKAVCPAPPDALCDVNRDGAVTRRDAT